MFLQKFKKQNMDKTAKVENVSKIEIPPPEMINLNINTKCNLRCKMCFNWDPKVINPDGLTTSEWKSIISQLGELFPGVSLAFSGSEPMLNPDIYHLIEYANNFGFRIWLQSNGSLINKERAKKLIEVGLENISLSLDSIFPEEHNTMRGTKKSYEQVMNAINYMCEVGINTININTVLCSYNIKNIENLVSWVESNNKIKTLTLQAVTQPFGTKTDLKWFQSKEHSHLWPQNYEIVLDSINSIIRNKGKYKKLVNTWSQLLAFKKYFKNPLLFIKTGCDVKSKQLNINFTGYTNICLMEDSGNLKNNSVKELWNSYTHKRIYNSMKYCSRNCHYLVNCAYED